MYKQTDPSPSKRRLPRLSRVADKHRPPFRLTARDAEIIRAVYTYRTLTSEQIERLFFIQPGQPRPSNTRCNLRLQGLFHYGFLARDEQAQKITDGRKPFLYLLDRRGADYLASIDDIDVDSLDWRPSHNRLSTLFLDHLLKTNDVRLEIERACRLQDALTLAQWIDDRTLKRDEMREIVTIKGARGQDRDVALIPDGYFRISHPDGSGAYHTLLEVDMGTESSRQIKQKIESYVAFWKSGRYTQRFNTKDSPMRVLFVTTSETRLRNMMRTTRGVKFSYSFWFTTFARLSAESVLFEPIWDVPTYDERMPFIFD
jgi:hypothetical protein